jgi:hypothetical protein
MAEYNYHKKNHTDENSEYRDLEFLVNQELESKNISIFQSKYEIAEIVVKRLQHEKFSAESLEIPVRNISRKILDFRVVALQEKDLKRKNFVGTIEIPKPNFNFFVVLTLKIQWSMNSVVKRLKNNVKYEYVNVQNNMNSTKKEHDNYTEYRNSIYHDIAMAEQQNGKIETLDFRFPYLKLNNNFLNEINLYINSSHGNDTIGQFLVI